MEAPPKSEARETVGAAPSLGNEKDRPNLDNATSLPGQEFNRADGHPFGGRSIDARAELDDALKRVEELLACWHWCRSLDHRLRLAQLRFDHCGYPADEQKRLEQEVAEFKYVCRWFAEGSKRERSIAA